MMVSNPFYFPCVVYEIISEKPRQFNLFYPGGGGGHLGRFLRDMFH